MKVHGTINIASNQGWPRMMLYSKSPQSNETWFSIVLGPRDRGIKIALRGISLDAICWKLEGYH
jgi:hypothetical protein